MSAPTRPSRDLKGKVAIVSGAGALGDHVGNGRASAILLAEVGAAVVCVDRDVALAERTAQMIKEEGKGQAIAVAADVTNEEQCQAVVGKTMAEFGRIDILVNIVGVMGAKGSATDVDMEEWAKGMDINVASMVKMSKYCIPMMLKNTGQWRGSIVNLSSVAGMRGGTPHLFYPTSKGAIINLTRAMAFHHGGQGIRVNCVCPGMLYTPMMFGDGMSEDTREARKNRSLLKTEGNGWDCGAAVRYLASDESRFLTGVILPVDAGATCSTAIELGSRASDTQSDVAT